MWEVTCTNPGTKEIKFSWFPVMGADFTTHPLPEGVKIEGGKVVFEQGSEGQKIGQTDISPASTTPQTPKKYWE